MSDTSVLKIISIVGYSAVGLILLLILIRRKYWNQLRGALAPPTQEYNRSMVHVGYYLFAIIPLFFLITFIPQDGGVGKTMGWILLSFTGVGIMLITWQRWIEPHLGPYIDLLPASGRYTVESGYPLHFVRMMKCLALFFRFVRTGLLVVIVFFVLRSILRNPAEEIFSPANQQLFLTIAAWVAIIALRYLYRKLM